MYCGPEHQEHTWSCLLQHKTQQSLLTLLLSQKVNIILAMNAVYNNFPFLPHKDHTLNFTHFM